MDANENVYRYISFENFVDVVINEKLTLVSPLSFWEDTYEGWLFRMLQQKYSESLSNQFPQNPLQAIQLLGKSVVAQCWTKNCICCDVEHLLLLKQSCNDKNKAEQIGLNKQNNEPC